MTGTITSWFSASKSDQTFQTWSESATRCWRWAELLTGRFSVWVFWVTEEQKQAAVAQHQDLQPSWMWLTAWREPVDVQHVQFLVWYHCFWNPECCFSVWSENFTYPRRNPPFQQDQIKRKTEQCKWTACKRKCRHSCQLSKEVFMECIHRKESSVCQTVIIL